MLGTYFFLCLWCWLLSGCVWLYDCLFYMCCLCWVHIFHLVFGCGFSVSTMCLVVLGNTINHVFCVLVLFLHHVLTVLGSHCHQVFGCCAGCFLNHFVWLYTGAYFSPCIWLCCVVTYICVPVVCWCFFTFILSVLGAFSTICVRLCWVLSPCVWLCWVFFSYVAGCAGFSFSTMCLAEAGFRVFLCPAWTFLATVH